MSNSIEEKAKKLKEITDLKSEIQKTERLLHEGKANDLSTHLQDLSTKYFLEKGSYNLLHQIPPQNVWENAQNCIHFLSALLASKLANIDDKK